MLCKCTMSPLRIPAVAEPITAPYLRIFWPEPRSHRAILNPRCTLSLKVTCTPSMVTTSPRVRFVRAMTTLSSPDNSSSLESELSVISSSCRFHRDQLLTLHRHQGYTDEVHQLLSRRDLDGRDRELVPARRYFQYTQLARDDITFVQIGRRVARLDRLLEGLAVHRDCKFAATDALHAVIGYRHLVVTAAADNHRPPDAALRVGPIGRARARIRVGSVTNATRQLRIKDAIVIGLGTTDRQRAPAANRRVKGHLDHRNDGGASSRRQGNLDMIRVQAAHGQGGVARPQQYRPLGIRLQIPDHERAVLGSRKH